MNINAKKLLKLYPRLALALTILIRIKERYPYIFGECTTDEELQKLREK